MACSPRLQPHFFGDSDFEVPTGWTKASFADLSTAISVGKKWENKSVATSGKVPVIDQSQSAVIGFHNEPPGVSCSQEQPVFTFANHTCAMRWRVSPFSCIQNVFAFRGVEGVSTSYLYYASMGRVVLEEYKGHAPQFRSMWLPVAPARMQEKIGALLRQIDDRIDLLRQTNTTLEAIAQALFKSWFVDFDHVRAKAEGRAPITIDAATAALFASEFEESALGFVPKGWRTGTLSELSELNAAKWTSRVHPEEIEYLDLSGVTRNDISPATKYSFDDAPGRARLRLREGDTIVGTVRPGNRAFAYIHAPVLNLTGSTGFAVLSPKQPQAASLVYLAATRDESIDRLAHLADGGAYPAVRPSVVTETPCVIAPALIVSAFSDLTKPMLERIAENRVAAETLAKLRDTLLPRLISGKLRLPEGEALIQDITA